MVRLWGLINLVRAVVREKENFEIFQFYDNPHPNTSLYPSQTSCLNREKNQVRRLVKSLVRKPVRSLVKSLTPSLSHDQPFSL
jgi:hypothetical protein